MTIDNDLIQWAAQHATSLLSPLGSRWLHVQGVVERAKEIGEILNQQDQASLIAAAYLHDIGYAPELQKTGFHPLDGALYLRSLGKERLASLVAHHSEARFEARLRGCEAALEAFPREHSAVADALTYCDLTTDPMGQSISLKERAKDIYTRYGELDVVTQAMRQSMPYVSLAIARTKRRLRKHEKSMEVIR
ncbi:MAG TPA: HD domain-containing protein [Ktedonobacteraceae bacterium]|nr:HD domain-containing protein [Ktedonobacteraceae bacterium]